MLLLAVVATRRTHVCRVCKKELSSRSALRDHARVHTGDTSHLRFRCTRCDKRFGRVGHLAVHQRVHTHIKPYKCANCGKKYGHKHPYERHVRRKLCQQSQKTPTVVVQSNTIAQLKLHITSLICKHVSPPLPPLPPLPEWKRETMMTVPQHMYTAW